MSFFTRLGVLAGVITVFVLQGLAASGMAFPGPPIAREWIRTERYFDLTIHGRSMATKEQCVDYLLRRNRLPFITTSPRQLVDFFYQEALLEGIRPDVAFAQALHETGNFGYGGDVVALQNNYCGLGTTGGGVKGAWFPTAQIGVRAQIQHLLAYSSRRPPLVSIVDPRYELVKKTSFFGRMVTWSDLNGKWAVPGRTYGQMIQTIHEAILTGK